ncbi:hypothetical protein NHX12_008318 [Muraenolepis orangiensis]|uniref:Myb/SANT-like DNA-binding domain-containing protein 4 n=1 Tax=Muraenolepis orangiensis TaxID=630683 RepID=A0A9Q0IB55_9TELE|nr:hypothetical protein NHX12_008318 [Muraenolepis orangiensis]
MSGSMGGGAGPCASEGGEVLNQPTRELFTVRLYSCKIPRAWLNGQSNLIRVRSTSVRETQTLIREIHKRQDVLFSRQQNTAINELKRQAWEEVKRRYLDWRTLMKRKQLCAKLSMCLSSASSLALKEEYEPSSPEHDAAMLGSACDQLLDLSGFPKDHQCNWQELVALGEPSGHTMMTTTSGVKMEEDASEYRTDSDRDVADGELDEDDCFSSLLGEMASRGEVCVPEVYCHGDQLGMPASSSSCCKAPTSTTPYPSISTTHRDFPLAEHGDAPGGPEGVQPPRGETTTTALAAAAASGFEHTSTAALVVVEKQRLEMERQRLAVEMERLDVERERLAVERERLQTERERCHLERERLRAPPPPGQSRRTAEEPAQQQGPPSSSTAPDGRKERAAGEEGGGGSSSSGGGGVGQGWWAGSVAAELETERLRLEKERLQLEKERLQFFKFESGRLQIERERLQVEKDRMLLQNDQH